MYYISYRVNRVRLRNTPSRDTELKVLSSMIMLSNFINIINEVLSRIRSNIIGEGSSRIPDLSTSVNLKSYPSPPPSYSGCTRPRRYVTRPNGDRF